MGLFYPEETAGHTLHLTVYSHVIFGKLNTVIYFSHNVLIFIIWRRKNNHWFFFFFEKHCIPEDLWELAALAQHYGIPTRLLDWTHDLHTALYFAVESYMKNKYIPEETKSIVLWALSYRTLVKFSAILWWFSFLPSSSRKSKKEGGIGFGGSDYG